jgi:hypothetical protein
MVDRLVDKFSGQWSIRWSVGRLIELAVGLSRLSMVALFFFKLFLVKLIVFFCKLIWKILVRKLRGYTYPVCGCSSAAVAAASRGQAAGDFQKSQ